MGSREPLAPMMPCPVCGRSPGDGQMNDGTYSRYCYEHVPPLTTRGVESRPLAAEAWNALVDRHGAVDPQPRPPAPSAGRGPLAGWRAAGGRSLRSASGVNMVALPSGFWLAELRSSGVAQSFGAGNLPAAQLAAEDAARALVAEMAAALGGSVTWATEGGE